MNKNKQLNIKKMIFELGRGGCKNHFFDRVNEEREVERFFADAQNDGGDTKRFFAGAQNDGGSTKRFVTSFRMTQKNRLGKMCDICHSERAIAIEESCDTKRFFAGAQNDSENTKRFFADAQNDGGVQCKRGRAARKFSRPLLEHNAGRSMLEMLGVLAIVGLLSVGAVVGFRYAMNRHKANETIYDVMLRATNVPMAWDNYAELHDFKYLFPELIPNDTNPVGFAVETWAEPVASKYAYRVEVADVPSAVCRQIIALNPPDISLYKAGAAIDRTGTNATQDDCGSDKTNMYFLFEAGWFDPTPGPDPTPDPGPDPEPEPECATNNDCAAGQICKDGICEDCTLNCSGACERLNATTCSCESLAGCTPCANAGECPSGEYCNEGECQTCDKTCSGACEELDTATCSCVAKSDCTPCSDSSECGDGQYCNGGKCEGCDKTCTGACEELDTATCSCVAKSNCTPCSDSSECGDGQYCNGGKCDVCDLTCAGACEELDTATCSCVAKSDCTPCSDSSECSEGQYCNGGKCDGCDLTCAGACEELDTATCSCATKSDCTPCTSDADCESGSYCDGVVCTPCPSAQSGYVCCSVKPIDGDNPFDHVWVGDPLGEGYCCTSKDESEECCTAYNADYVYKDGKCQEFKCDEGYEAVTNYASDGTKSGKACCEVKVDYDYKTDQPCTGALIGTDLYVTAGWTNVGAINGTCCGGNTKDFVAHCGKNGWESETLYTTYSREIRVDNGSAYCFTDFTEIGH